MHEGDGFSVNTLRKNGFHLLTDWSGNVQAGQFWQMENALDSFLLLLLLLFFTLANCKLPKQIPFHVYHQATATILTRVYLMSEYTANVNVM